MMYILLESYYYLQGFNPKTFKIIYVYISPIFSRWVTYYCWYIVLYVHKYVCIYKYVRMYILYYSVCMLVMYVLRMYVCV